jgi:hypothetical protein
MIDEEMFRIIQLVGLDHFVFSDAYELKEVEGKAVVEAKFSCWFAKIRSNNEYADPIRIPGGHKWIGAYWLFMTRTRDHHRGYLLFPSIREPYDREFGGANPLAPIDLSGWEDPVAAALKSFNLSPFDDSHLQSIMWEYQLAFETWNGGGGFICGFPTRRDPLDPMWDALLAASRQFIERYDDDEMWAYAEHMGLIR